MPDTSIMPLLYSMEETCPVPWTEAAEAQLHHDYPFLNQDDTDESFVIRRYLEMLWLPESFNPLAHLITSLHRIRPLHEASSSRVHSLHSLLQPLLLSTRAASDKYRTELVQILANGGGAEEQEETMMWYAWEHEKAENDEDGKVDEEKWRKAWLERLERREAMIQILLHMLKLSLPGLKPPEDAKPKKRKKKKADHELPPETDEERLESYMDKLSVWQLTSTLDTAQVSSQMASSSRGKAKAERHWTQAFYEDVVEPLFKAELPERCELFRSKLYPESPFSDVEGTDAETLLNGRASRAGSRAPSVSRGPLARVPSVSSTTRHGLQRSRSRSLSVSLAQDEASQRANLVPPKRALSREVSMSLVFKEKSKTHTKFKMPHEEHKLEPGQPKTRRDMGTTLVQETPVKRRRGEPANFDGQACWNSWGNKDHFRVPTPPPKSSSPGDVCMEDTPVVMRKRQSQAGLEDCLSPLTPLPDETLKPSSTARRKGTKTRGGKAGTSTSVRVSSQSTRSRQSARLKATTETNADEHADESYMDAFKSSNVTLLGNDEEDVTMISPSPATRTKRHSLLNGRFHEAEIADAEMATPTKKRTRRK